MKVVERHLSRRRAIAALGVTALGAGLAPQSSLAGRGWCRSDPLVIIGGVLADIFVVAPVRALVTVSGPTKIDITVPRGVHGSVVLAGVGFGRGEKVTFLTSNRLQRTDEGIEIKVAVWVPCRDNSLAIDVELAPRVVGILDPERASGKVNRWVTMRTDL